MCIPLQWWCDIVCIDLSGCQDHAPISVIKSKWKIRHAPFWYASRLQGQGSPFTAVCVVQAASLQVTADAATAAINKTTGSPMLESPYLRCTRELLLCISTIPGYPGGCVQRYIFLGSVHRCNFQARYIQVKRRKNPRGIYTHEWRSIRKIDSLTD
jgi:hypothetical protein